MPKKHDGQAKLTVIKKGDKVAVRATAQELSDVAYARAGSNLIFFQFAYDGTSAADYLAQMGAEAAKAVEDALGYAPDATVVGAPKGIELHFEPQEGDTATRTVNRLRSAFISDSVQSQRPYDPDRIHGTEAIEMDPKSLGYGRRDETLTDRVQNPVVTTDGFRHQKSG